jgi:hypothetical protein
MITQSHAKFTQPLFCMKTCFNYFCRRFLPESKMKKCPHCSGSGIKEWFEDAGRKISNEFTNPDSVLRSQVVPVATSVAKSAADVASMAGVPGAGVVSKGLEVLGAGRKRRRIRGKGEGPLRPAPPHTSSRNAVVLKVMKERGIKLPAASKAVKDEGLWKP